MKPLGSRGTHYWLLQGMLQRSGADAVTAFESGVLAPRDWAAMVETCRGCRAPCACRRFLDAPNATRQNPPAYCENAPALAGLPRRADRENV